MLALAATRVHPSPNGQRRSPTCAATIACSMPGPGRVTVSDRKSINAAVAAAAMVGGGH